MVTVEKFINDLKQSLDQSRELNLKIKLGQFKFDSMFRANSEYVRFLNDHITGKLGLSDDDNIFETKVSFDCSLDPSNCRIFYTCDPLKEDWRFTDDILVTDLIKFLSPSENTIE